MRKLKYTLSTDDGMQQLKYQREYIYTHEVNLNYLNLPLHL
jgi:hypothetical protein